MRLQENGAPPGVGKIADTDKQDVGRFLNRLLGLEPAWQCYFFDFFQALMEHVIAAAKREGKYQDGITDLRATHITMSEPPKVLPSSLNVPRVVFALWILAVLGKTAMLYTSFAWFSNG